MDPTEIQNEVKKAVEPVMTAFEEFKKTNDERIKAEAKGAVDVLTTDKLSKIETTLAGYEGLNQKLALAEKQNKAMEEQMGAMDALIAKLEAKLGRAGLGGKADRIELKNKVNAWASAVIYANTSGVANLNDEQKKALQYVQAAYKVLRISDDTTGGYLAPPEFVQEIIQAVVLVSNARSIVTVRQTANKSVRIPKRTGVFAAQRVTEQGTRSETTGLTFGLEEITAPEMYAIVDISNEDLEDSAFDLEQYIRDNAAEQFAVKEGQEFVTGTGNGQLEGILSNATLTGTNFDKSGNAATISADGVLSISYNLKTAYAKNAAYILNRSVIGSVRKLKDSYGQYLWMPGLAQGVPNMINSSTYYEMPDMPNEGANAFPIAFGDWKRGYVMVDRIAMSFLRDPYTQGASGNVRMWFRRRVGGQVVLADALRLLKCST